MVEILSPPSSSTTDLQGIKVVVMEGYIITTKVLVVEPNYLPNSHESQKNYRIEGVDFFF
jgi:hypothetical protein